MNLVSVYQYPDADRILYDLLKEREGADDINISHSGETPPWRQHLKFFRSKPYRVWFMILDDDDQVAGSVYLSKNDEIGVHLFKRFRKRGLGGPAVQELMERTPRKRYLANINPRNKASVRFFEKLGFEHLQDTYALSR